jgi:hypothetical protein
MPSVSWFSSDDKDVKEVYMYMYVGIEQGYWLAEQRTRSGQMRCLTEIGGAKFWADQDKT